MQRDGPQLGGLTATPEMPPYLAFSCRLVRSNQHDLSWKPSTAFVLEPPKWILRSDRRIGYDAALGKPTKPFEIAN